MFKQSKYNFLLQRIIRYDYTFQKMGINTKDIYECYISTKKSNGIILGRDFGIERFGVPYDYFRSGFIVPQMKNE